MITEKEKKLINQCQDFMVKSIELMSSMTKSERDEYWRCLSEFEKDILLIGFFKNHLTK